MRVYLVFFLFVAVSVSADNPFWAYSQNLLNGWFRHAKTATLNATKSTTLASLTDQTKTTPTTIPIKISTDSYHPVSKNVVNNITSLMSAIINKTTPHSTKSLTLLTTTPVSTTVTDLPEERSTSENIDTTIEPRENHRTHNFYLSKRDKHPVVTNVASNISQNLLPLPAGASAALVKPTKYHYYPHNQHIYLLPECAIQQVCNAIYIRLNWTQPLCACPSRYRDPCSASLNSDDQHTTELMLDRHSRSALTLVKTCEPISDVRICRSPRDWSLLALQNIRTGKSHYLVICRCPETSQLEGPISHDQPTYASVPGIRVYGMICTDNNKRRGRTALPPFPEKQAYELSKTVEWKN